MGIRYFFVCQRSAYQRRNATNRGNRRKEKASVTVTQNNSANNSADGTS